jgi:hypothetical protein
MRIIDMDAQTAACDSEVPAPARGMYDLLGSNMTALCGDEGRNWRSEREFAKWHEDVCVDGLSKGAGHILLDDGQGLPAIPTFTAPSDAGEVFVNEVQIRPSSRTDGVTFRRPMQRFAARAGTLPHTIIWTYANQCNAASQQLIRHTERTERRSCRGSASDSVDRSRARGWWSSRLFTWAVSDGNARW